MAAVSSVLDELSRHPRWAHLASLGIGSAGPVDTVAGTVSPVNIPAWRGFPLVERVAAHPRLPVGLRPVLVGDAVAMTAAEHWKRRGAWTTRCAWSSPPASAAVSCWEGRCMPGRRGMPGTSGTSAWSRTARSARAAPAAAWSGSPAARPSPPMPWRRGGRRRPGSPRRPRRWPSRPAAAIPMRAPPSTARDAPWRPPSRRRRLSSSWTSSSSAAVSPRRGDALRPAPPPPGRLRGPGLHPRRAGRARRPGPRRRADRRRGGRVGSGRRPVRHRPSRVRPSRTGAGGPGPHGAGQAGPAAGPAGPGAPDPLPTPGT